MTHRRLAVVGSRGRAAALAREFARLGALRLGTERPALDQLLADPTIDGLVVATEPDAQLAICRAALTAGKDLFVEPPLAAGIAGAEELVALADSQSRILQVGCARRYHPAVLKLQELVGLGVLGRIEHIYAHRFCPGQLRPGEELTTSFAPDDLAVVLGLLEAQPVRVAAHGTPFLGFAASDVTLTAITFSGGVIAHTFVSWLHPLAAGQLVVIGSRGLAVLDDALPGIKLARPAPGPKPTSDAKASDELVPYLNRDPLLAECEHFLDCCTNRLPPRADGHEYLRLLRVLAAAEESLLAQGRLVSIGDAHPDLAPEEETAGTPSAEAWPLTVSQTTASPTIVTRNLPPKLAPVANVVSASPRLGPDTVVAPGALVASSARIGAGCRIGTGTIIGSGVEIDDNVSCGNGAAVGDSRSAATTRIRRGAVIGNQATIAAGCTLGQYCRVGDGAVVTADVPDYAVVAGTPARFQGWTCACGVSLVFVTARTRCPGCGGEYELVDNRARPCDQQRTV